MPLDSTRTRTRTRTPNPRFVPPTYLTQSRRPEVLVDQYRVMLMDPTDQSIVGIDGLWGSAGHLGRLAYANRTSSNRGF